MISLNLGWVLVVVAVAVILRQYVLRRQQFASLDDVVRIAGELQTLSNEAVKRVKDSRVALGYNANLDGVAKASDVLGEFLAPTLAARQAPIDPRDHAKISTELELAECFLHFFSAGAAAERFVERALFDRIVSAVRQNTHTVLSPGGNAALMANRVAALGGAPLLGGPVGPSLRPLLHSSIRTVVDVTAVENDDERKAKRDAVDEFHLIFEYAANETFAQSGAVSPRANRFILHSDDNNGRIEGLEAFHRSLRRFQPTIVVVAGLHLLQEQKATFRTSRIAELRSQLCSVPHSVAVHFEFASIGDKAFVRELATTLLADIDSMGMNEQELADLYFALGGKLRTTTEIASGGQYAVLHAIAFLFASADSIASKQTLRTCATRRLTRIHFHYLSYHIVATRGERWSGTGEAAAAGSWATTTQACALSSDNPFDATLVELRVSAFETLWHGRLLNVLDAERDEPLADANFTLVPVLVCKRPIRTVGLGDAISATALVTQILNEPQINI